MSAFSENLKKAREARGWNQQIAARYCCVKRSAYAAWEEDRAYPTLRKLPSLIKAFSVKDLQAFLFDSDYSNEALVEIEKENIPPTVLEERYQLASIREKLAVNILLGLVDLE